MGTGLQGEVEEIHEDLSSRAPLTRILAFVAAQIYRLWRGYRPSEPSS